MNHKHTHTRYRVPHGVVFPVRVRKADDPQLSTSGLVTAAHNVRGSCSTKYVAAKRHKQGYGTVPACILIHIRTNVLQSGNRRACVIGTPNGDRNNPFACPVVLLQSLVLDALVAYVNWSFGPLQGRGWRCRIYICRSALLFQFQW